MLHSPHRTTASINPFVDAVENDPDQLRRFAWRQQDVHKEVLQFAETLLGLGENSETKRKCLEFFLGSKLETVFKLVSGYQSDNPENLCLESLRKSYAQCFARGSNWYTFTRTVLDHQKEIGENSLQFRMKLYSVIRDKLKDSSDSEAVKLDPESLLPVRSLIDSWKDLNDFFDLQILLIETKELRKQNNVEDSGFINDVLQTVPLEARKQHCQLHLLTVIAKMLIYSSNPDYRKFYSERLSNLEEPEEKLRFTENFIRGYYYRQLNEVCYKFLKGEDLSYLENAEQRKRFGKQSNFTHGDLFTRFIEPDCYPRSVEHEQIEKVKGLMSDLFLRMYKHSYGFGSLRYDTASIGETSSIVAEMGLAGFNTIERIHSAEGKAYPGRGYKLSGTRMDHFFAKGKGDKPFESYERAWPKLAGALQFDQNTEVYLTPAFKIFANSEDKRLNYYGTQYALVQYGHHLNYSGFIAMLVRLDFIREDVAGCLCSLEEYAKGINSARDFSNSKLIPENMLNFRDPEGYEIFFVGSGSCLGGSFSNAFSDHNSYVENETNIGGLNSLVPDAWGKLSKYNVRHDDVFIRRHDSIFNAVVAGLEYSELFDIKLASFHKGQVKGNSNPYYMVEKAVNMHKSLKAQNADRSRYPVLYMSQTLDRSAAPYAHFSLDTFDLKIRDANSNSLATYSGVITGAFQDIWDTHVIPIVSPAHLDLRFYDRSAVSELTPFNLGS